MLSQTGNFCLVTLDSPPNKCQISSAKCGANGDNTTEYLRRELMFIFFNADHSFTAIIIADTEVLNDKEFMSRVILSISLCSIIFSSNVSVSDLSFFSNLKDLRKKPTTPFIPLVSQGLDCFIGPRNISYNLKASAPYLSQMESGLIILCFDFDIFSTSRSTIKTPFSSSNLESLYSGNQFLNPTKSSSLWSFTKLIST